MFSRKGVTWPDVQELFHWQQCDQCMAGAESKEVEAVTLAGDGEPPGRGQ